MKVHSFSLIIFAIVFASISQPCNATKVTLDTDRAVFTAALAHFERWKGVTFGQLTGVLEVELSTEVNPNATTKSVRALAQNISPFLESSLIESFIARNKASVSISPFILGLPSIRLRQKFTDEKHSYGPPVGAKAIGSLTLPGYSKNGFLALLQIRHSWSEHLAIVTYVLANKKGNWVILARTQVVYP